MITDPARSSNFARLAEIRDDLIECRRYLYSHPDETKRTLRGILGRFRQMQSDNGFLYGPEKIHLPNHVGDDLWIVIEAVAIDAEAAIGGIYLICYQIGAILSADRLKSERPARDAELDEAYTGLTVAMMEARMR